METWLIGFVGGLGLWTLLEYVLHRFVFHRRWLGKLAAREHMTHHAKVDYFSPFVKKVALAIPVLGVIVLAASAAMGLRLGTSVPLGVLAGWATYEVIHRRIHVSAPVGSYGLWARRHHLLHHFGRSDMNHGVTTPIWDWVFGTLAARETVRVPRQHATKFPWLLEAELVSAAPVEASTPRRPRIAGPFEGEYRIV